MSFLQGCIHASVMLQYMVLLSRTHAALSGLGGFERKRRRKSEGNVDKLEGREERGCIW